MTFCHAVLANYYKPVLLRATPKKGIIFVAKVLSRQEFRPQDEHDKIDWITEDQLKNYTEANTVSDFEQTATLVFQNFNKYFPEMGEHTL